MNEIDWPALCAGGIVGAYWARVLRLVVKARRATGRTANLVPPEPLGRLLRIVWYPTVVAWIAIPFYVAFFGAKAPAALRRFYYEPFSQWVGAAVAFAALGATLVCWKRMGTSWRMGIDPGEKTRLIVAGPYAYVRHPIYALSSLLMLATVLVVAGGGDDRGRGDSPLVPPVGSAARRAAPGRRARPAVRGVHAPGRAVRAAYADAVWIWLEQCRGRLTRLNISAG